MNTLRVLSLALLGFLPQQVTGQDLDKILERADKLLEEAKAGYESARSKASPEAFVDAGFKLEEARIKYLVLQEIGSADKQKVAADRLRSVNQLSKLLHDGKVAVSAPSEEGRKPDAAPPPPPPKAGADVTQRAAVPDAAKQREAEKLVRDLFKEQYAKKSPADRKALLRALMDQAAKSQDDAVSLWVLLREAQDVAVQTADAKAAIDSIEGMARFFDIDAPALKTAALAAVGKNARTPEEFSSLAGALLRVIDELIAVDQYDVADKSAQSLVQHARKANDSELLAQATLRSKEVAEAKTLFQAMKNQLEVQAKNPDDPGANLEIGRFLCFVKGSWDLGLRFMVKGSDPGLKALAEKEVAIPMQPIERASLADGWYDLAEREKSPLRKHQLLVHAKSVYDGALPGSTGLIRAKIEKRLGDLEAAGIGKSPARPDKPVGDGPLPKAIAYLKGRAGGLKQTQHANVNIQEDEIFLLALISAGVTLDDPDIQKLFKAMMERKLEAVYIAALQAIVLEEIDRVKYQWRIHKCAQFLIDNQGASGRWHYGSTSPAADQMPQGDLSLTAVRPQGAKLRPTRRLPVRKMSEPPAEGDHSNSAYAAMGLRACHDAGIALPTESLALAERAWRQSHKSGQDAGWCYSTHNDHRSYGSMTACGVSSLAAYDYMKGGKSWKADKDVQDGIAWLTRNFSVKYHPGPYEHAQMANNSPQQLYYYLYSLERAAMLTGTESFGPNKWHAEGVKALQASQNADGSWGVGVVDTCLAVLFLTRATRPLEAAPSGK